MAMHPMVLGLTVDPNLTYNTHIHNISVHVHMPLQIIKVLTATGWCKQKETFMATYKAVMRRPALEYASFIWSPLSGSASMNKLQVMQNAAWRTVSGCTQTHNICMTKHPYFPYAIQTENTNIHHIPYTNIHHTSTLSGLKTLSSTTAAAQQTFPHTPHSHYNRHKIKHAPYTYIYCL